MFVMMLYKKKLESIMPAASGLKTLFSSSLVARNSSPRPRGPIDSVIKLKKGGIMTYLKLRF